MGFTSCLRGVVVDPQQQLVNVPLVLPFIDEESIQLRLRQGGDRVIRLTYSFALLETRRPTDADAVVNTVTQELELTVEAAQKKFTEKLHVGLNAPQDKWLQMQRPLELGFELLLRFRSGSSHMYIREWCTLMNKVDRVHRKMLDSALKNSFGQLRRQHPTLFSPQ